MDAGTGLHALGSFHGQDLPKDVDLLFSHLHLDHTTGLVFFKPAVYDTERTNRTWCGNLGGESAQAALNRLYSPPLFPITLDVLPVRFEHRGFRAGERLTFADGAVVDTIPLNHPQGSVGYRFRYGGRTACYISDLEHSEVWPDPALTEFCRDADLVIYDGMFTEGEYPRCKGWGHSTWEKGVELCKAAGAKELAIVHLHPGHDDAMLREIEAKMQAAMPRSFFAREGQSVLLPALTEA